MDYSVNQQEEGNRKRGIIISTAVHILLVALILLPLLTYPDPPPGQEGILVNMGMPDEGDGMENAPLAQKETPVETSEPEQNEPEEVKPEPEPVKEKPEPAKPEPKPEKEVIKTKDPDQIALERKKEKERKEKAEKDRKEREEEARKKAEAEQKRKAEEAKKQAEEDARKKREAEAKATKDQIGSLFGSGEGKGNTGKEGNQGDPDGDPDASRLDGISTGPGQVGGGLGGRGVLNSPNINDDFGRPGTVVIEVCVDNKGTVTSAEYTQRGSTTTDSQLRDIAIRNAKRWKFSRGSVDKQCGTITYEFKVR